jgi:hypothetical protein
MALSTQQRYIAFFGGVGVSCVLLTIYFGVRGLPQPPELPAPGVIRREVPGAVLQWMAESKPIEGAFVLSQDDARKAGGVSSGRFSRFLVVPGLDPGAYIRIEEIAASQEPDKIADWKFMFADHVRVLLQPNADTRAMATEMAKLGWHFSGGKDKEGWVTIILKDHQANSVGQAQWQLQQWPQWVAKAEPDYLPAPTIAGTGGGG